MLWACERQAEAIDIERYQEAAAKGDAKAQLGLAPVWWTPGAEENGI